MLKEKRSDIHNKQDIQLLVNEFYSKVQKDKILSPYFQHLNWENHLPIMYSFWENILFHSGDYSGNPMTKHQHLHEKTPLNKEAFQQWQQLFKETVFENFEGTNSEIIVQRANSIATVMKMKILHNH